MGLNLDEAGKLPPNGSGGEGGESSASTRGSQASSGALDERQRRVVSYLDRKDDGTASFVELIDLLTGRGIGTPDQSEIDRLALSLYYVDLPTLAELGVVEYDKRSRTVRYRGNAPGTTRRGEPCGEPRAVAGDPER